MGECYSLIQALPVTRLPEPTAPRSPCQHTHVHARIQDRLCFLSAGQASELSKPCPRKCQALWGSRPRCVRKHMVAAGSLRHWAACAHAPPTHTMELCLLVPAAHAHRREGGANFQFYPLGQSTSHLWACYCSWPGGILLNEIMCRQGLVSGFPGLPGGLLNGNFLLPRSLPWRRSYP